MQFRDLGNIINDFFKNPTAIDRFERLDYASQLKVRFTYYLTLSLFITMFVIILFTFYTQSSNPNRIDIQWSVILTEVIILFVFGLSFYLIIRGFFRIVAHLILVFSFSAVWVVMFLNKGEVLAQLDTVVYILVIISTTPTLISGEKRVILAYTLMNLIILFLFAYSFSKYYNGPRNSLSEYVIEVSIAIVFSGIVAYNNFRINKIALNSALNDLKARQVAEELLVLSEKKFRDMIELLPYSVIATDMEGRHIIVNSAYCKEIDCSKEEAIGKTAIELGYIVDEQTMQIVNNLLLTSGIAENIECTVTKKNGIVSYVYFSCKMIKLNDQIVVLSSSIDISEKKKTEMELDNYRKNLEILIKERTDELLTANEELSSTNEELKTVNDELSSKNQIINDKNDELNATLQNLKETQSKLIQSEKMASLGVLTAGVAHEINNPLNFIMGGYAGLENYLSENNGLQNEKVAIFLKSIKTGVERTNAIVKSLNQFSRSKDTYGENCDIHAILDDCLVLLNNTLKDYITVHKNYCHQTLQILGNVGKINQVFFNIINNAVQSIKNEGTITITTYKIKDYINIEIADSGCGISEENMPKIIEPFFTTKDPGKGTGLGLFISYNLIKEHKGNLEFESEINKGTTVRISLPVNLE